MHIHLFDEATHFNQLRQDWDAVYEADPEAQLFLSWEWLRDWLTIHRSVWFVLAAKRKESDDEYVAFLPMRMFTGFDKKRGFYNELVFAGEGFSDYTGILSKPEFEAEAVAAFAECLKRKLNWARLTIENLTMSDHRRRLFLRAFDKVRFVQTAISYKFPDDPTNHAICPSINLPSSWQEYLDILSTNNRQKIRRLLKKLDRSEECRITVSDPESFDQNLTMLLDFWKIKWTPKKGEKADEIARLTDQMLGCCAKNGTLFLPVFWHRDRPVAALATLIDRCKKSLLFVITGRDERYREIPAGYLLHAFSIRHAIAHGFATYDFLKGNEPYKYLFAPQVERHQKPVSIATKTNRNLGGKLNPRGLPDMLAMALGFENQDDPADAELGYRQILDLAPDNALALYRFGRLMARNGAHLQAKKLLGRSVEVEPRGDNAWFWLGRSLQALGENEAALAAYREVVKLQPENKEAKELIVQLGLAVPQRAPAADAATLHSEVAVQQKLDELRSLTQDYFDAFVNPRPRW